MAACTPLNSLVDISFDCDVPIGGLKSLYVGYLNGSTANSIGGWDLVAAEINAANQIHGDTSSTYMIDGEASTLATTWTANTQGDVFVPVAFNANDEVSNFSDEKTVNTNGTSETVPTIEVEIPLMAYDRQQALIEMSRAGLPLVAAVETAAGTYHVVGADFGLVASVSGSSGSQRSDKNVYTLSLTGRERELAITFKNDAGQAKAGYEALVGLKAIA